MPATPRSQHVSRDGRDVLPRSRPAPAAGSAADAPAASALDGLTRLASRLLRAPAAVLCPPGDGFPACPFEPASPAEPLDGDPRRVLRQAAAALPARLAGAAESGSGVLELEHGTCLFAPVRQATGALYVVDAGPRAWTAEEHSLLRDLAAFAGTEIELRCSLHAANRDRAEKEAALGRVTDGFYTMDVDWRFTYLNAAAGEMFREFLGRPPEELIGRRLWDEFEGGTETQFYRQYQQVMTAQTPARFVEQCPVTRRWFAIHAYPSPSGLSVFFQDVTAGKRLEQVEATRTGVTRVLAEAATLDAAAAALLPTIARAGAWVYGGLWAADRGGGALRCVRTWHDAGPEIAAFAVETERRSFVPGEGLPGRAASEGTPSWVEDVALDRGLARAAAALEANLRAAVAFPIRLDGRVLGVLEFFGRETRAAEPEFLAMLDEVGSQIGQFIERRRAEEAVRSSEARKAAVLATSLDAIITIDQEGRILEFNPAAERTFGCAREEVMGRDLAELVMPPPLRERHREGMRRYLATGEGTVLGRRVELPAQRADGTEITVELTVNRIPSEERPVFTGTVRDITERKRADALLAAQRAVLEKVARGVGLQETLAGVAALVEQQCPGCVCSILTLDGEGRLRYGAAPGLPESFAGGVDGAGTFPRTGPCALAAAERQPVFSPDLQADPRWHPEFQSLAARYGLRACSSTPILSAQGITIGTLAVYSPQAGTPIAPGELLKTAADLAGIAIERKQGEAQLRERAEALAEEHRHKDEFLAMLAHELRNPLAAIQYALQIMQALDGGGGKLRDARQVVERQVELLTRLVDDLLDVARITRGRIELRPECVELGRVVSHAVETVRAAVDARGHTLEVSTPLDALYLTADPRRLEQVFANVLNNAAKYTPPGGRIRLSIERERGEAVVRVRDTGIGIAPELLPRVFDLFVQAERSLDRTQGGIGIGLTLVRKLVELHGGAVEARSDGPGRGSEFIIRLPADPEERPRALAGSVEPPPRDPSRRVLVVDDNRDAANTLCDLLLIWGHQVTAAFSGPDALERAAATLPEVVLLDIGLPGMDGYEVARRLRLGPAGRALLVAVTGYGQEEDRQRAARAGFDLHLTKPVDVPDLRRVLSGSDRPAGRPGADP